MQPSSGQTLMSWSRAQCSTCPTAAGHLPAVASTIAARACTPTGRSRATCIPLRRRHVVLDRPAFRVALGDNLGRQRRRQPVPGPSAHDPRAGEHAPAQQAYIGITNPQAGAMVPNTFTVSGKGAGLPEGNVVVTAKDSAGQILAQKTTTLQGANVGIGGEGTWSVSLTVYVSDITQGASMRARRV